MILTSKDIEFFAILKCVIQYLRSAKGKAILISVIVVIALLDISSLVKENVVGNVSLEFASEDGDIVKSQTTNNGVTCTDENGVIVFATNHDGSLVINGEKYSAIVNTVEIGLLLTIATNVVIYKTKIIIGMLIILGLVYYFDFKRHLDNYKDRIVSELTKK